MEENSSVDLKPDVTHISLNQELYIQALGFEEPGSNLITAQRCSSEGRHWNCDVKPDPESILVEEVQNTETASFIWDKHLSNVVTEHIKEEDEERNSYTKAFQASLNSDIESKHGLEVDLPREVVLPSHLSFDSVYQYWQGL